MTWTIKVEIALSADLTDSTSWSWTDITSYVRFNPAITITRGRADEFSTAAPARCTLWLSNSDGRFFPRNPTGAYYGQLRRNTPLRVRVDPGTGYVTRFTGYVDEWPPRWDFSYRERHVEVTASGVLRRLQQGGADRSALYRLHAIQAYSTSPRPVAYWPCEDQSGALSVASGMSGGTPAAYSGMTPGGDSAVAGSDPLLTMTSAGSFTGLVPTYTDTGVWKVGFVTKLPSAPGSSAGLFGWHTTGTLSAWRWAVYPGAPDLLKLEAYSASGEQLADVGVDLETVDGGLYGRTLYLEATGTQNGTAVDWTYTVWSSAGGNGHSGSEAASTNGTVANVTVIGPGLFDGATLGHISVTDSTSYVFGQGSNIATGMGGETTQDRFFRLIEEEHIPYFLSGTDSGSHMGPQQKANAVTLLRDVEAADNGVLYEDTAGHLRLLTRADRENKTVTWTLDFSSGHISGWTVTDDDQKLRNDVEVTIPSGTAGRFVDQDSVDNEGLYQERLSLNLWTSDDPRQHASWRVRQGTVDEARYPGITVHLARSTGEIAEWLACDIGSRITVAHPPTGSPPDTVDLHLEGYTEVITPKTWTVTLNTSPAQPWQVGTVSAGVDADSSSSYLLDGVTAGATTIRVARSDVEPAWTTTAVPDDVNIGGEQVTATAIATNAVSFVNAGTAAHADNASVTPGMPASVQQGDLLLVFAAIRTTSGAVSTPSGYTALFTAANIGLYGKTHTGSESAPSVSFTGGAAGDTTSAQMAAFRNAQNAVATSTSAANAAAANIATPALTGVDRPNCLVLWLGWKQDDWTSVATLTGATAEIGEPSSTTGNDQGLVWDYVVQTNGGDLAANSFVVTGGTNQVSRGAVVAIKGDVQTFTVTRAVNTVSKAQTAGTAVALWRPLAVAL